MNEHNYVEMVNAYIKGRVFDNNFENKIIINAKKLLENGRIDVIVQEIDVTGDLCFYLKFNCKSLEYLENINKNLINYFRNSSYSFMEFIDSEMSFDNLSLVFINGGLITFIEDNEKEWENSYIIDDACSLIDGEHKKNLQP